MIEILKAFILGIVEGISEWLPISSTGHMILADELLQLNVSTEFMNMFLVVIQLGAILAVVVLYFNKLNPFSDKKTVKQRKATWIIWFKVIVACVPAAVIGILFEDAIDEALGSPYIVAAMLILYGVLFIVVENRNKDIEPRVKKFSEFTFKDALIIGALQVLALIPGTSRSGVTIVGGIMFGMSRTIAAEFTFYLSIPVMFGASFLKLLGFGFGFTFLEVAIMFVGCVTAFFVSVITIKFFMGYIKKNDFKIFGYYRIILGIVVFAYFLINS
ncbi:MAG: undecaprenyl-diphosphate phosphatase [Eubacteriales bacterium]